jgi:hypothetical protein
LQEVIILFSGEIFSRQMGHSGACSVKGNTLPGRETNPFSTDVTTGKHLTPKELPQHFARPCRDKRDTGFDLGGVYSTG